MRSLVLALGLSGTLVICAAPAYAQAASVGAEPAHVSRSTFQALRWIEGRWRGTGPGTPAFYEAYRFLDDSTLSTLTFSDSTLSTVQDSSVTRLRGGRLVSQFGSARWVATAVDSSAAHFVPLENASNEFTWRRAGPTTWRAELRSRDAHGQSQEQVYLMEQTRP